MRKSACKRPTKQEIGAQKAPVPCAVSESDYEVEGDGDEGGFVDENIAGSSDADASESDADYYSGLEEETEDKIFFYSKEI